MTRDRRLAIHRFCGHITASCAAPEVLLVVSHYQLQSDTPMFNGPQGPIRPAVRNRADFLLQSRQKCRNNTALPSGIRNSFPLLAII